MALPTTAGNRELLEVAHTLFTAWPRSAPMAIAPRIVPRVTFFGQVSRRVGKAAEKERHYLCGWGRVGRIKKNGDANWQSFRHEAAILDRMGMIAKNPDRGGSLECRG